MKTKNLATITMKEKIDDIIAFVTGDVLVTILALVHFDMLGMSLLVISWTEVAFKVVIAILVGFAGGAFGLFGKDCYVKYFRDKFMNGKKED